jgi:hypothetical protein
MTTLHGHHGRHALALKLRARYDENVAEHVIQSQHVIDASRAIFRVGKPGSPFYAAEVAALGFGTVYVNGDVDAVVFGTCSDRTWQEKLTWLAGDNYGYAEEKASIGSSCSEMARRHDPECAKADVLRWRRDKSLDADVAREAIEAIDNDDFYAAQHAIYRSTYERALHQCTAPRVLMAQALITKLCDLLGLGWRR